MLVTIIRTILLFLCLFSSSLPTFGQVPELINNPDFRKDAQIAVDSVYNFNFEEAEQRLSKWEQKYPEHPLWTLFEGMQLWWMVLSDLYVDTYDQQFFDMMKKTDYEAGRLLHRNPDHIDALLIRAISNGYIARHYANREQWVTSINYGRKAIQAYHYLLELQPKLSDLKLAEGLKLYYLDYIPDAYPVVKTVSWALPDGNKQQGLKALQEAADKAIFARAEATYFLGNINYNYEKRFGVAVRNFEKLYAQYPHNNYYARILIKSYFRQNRFDDALYAIDQIIQRWEEQRLPYGDVLKEELWTWKGRILSQKGKTQKAINYFKKAFSKAKELPKTQSRPFYVVSGYYAGKLLCEQGDNEQALTFLTKVIQADVKSKYQEQAEDLLRSIHS